MPDALQRGRTASSSPRCIRRATDASAPRRPAGPRGSGAHDQPPEAATRSTAARADGVQSFSTGSKRPAYAGRAPPPADRPRLLSSAPAGTARRLAAQYRRANRRARGATRERKPESGRSEHGHGPTHALPHTPPDNTRHISPSAMRASVQCPRSAPGPVKTALPPRDRRPSTGAAPSWW